MLTYLQEVELSKCEHEERGGERRKQHLALFISLTQAGERMAKCPAHVSTFDQPLPKDRDSSSEGRRAALLLLCLQWWPARVASNQSTLGTDWRNGQQRRCRASSWGPTCVLGVMGAMVGRRPKESGSASTQVDVAPIWTTALNIPEHAGWTASPACLYLSSEVRLSTNTFSASQLTHVG